MKVNTWMTLALAGLTISSVSATTIREAVEAGDIVIDEHAVQAWQGDELVLTYTEAATFADLKIDRNLLVTADYLVVGGGGAGGTMQVGGVYGADGGDAGVVLSGNDVSLKGAAYLIGVGAGGLTAPDATRDAAGGNGQDSTLIGGALNVVATGGAGGQPNAKGASSTRGKDGAGSGTTSAISGEEVVYAVGGAGGESSGDADGADGEANSGNGGAGCPGAMTGAGYVGGNGGSGLVILRLKSVESHATEGPILLYTYSGAPQGPVAGEGYVIDEGASTLTATDAGTYSVTVTPAEGWWWKDTGKSDTRELSWTIAPREVEKPTATPARVTYDGVPHTIEPSTDDAYDYDEELTTVTATDAGAYLLTAVLKNPEGVTNFVWKGESDYHRTAVGLWYIDPVRVERPGYSRELVYTGEEQAAVTIVSPIEPALTPEGKESVVAATDAGRYEFVLKPGPDSTNYVWADTNDSAPWDVLWSITSARNAITSFVQPGWRLGTVEEPPAPELVARFGAETAVYTYAASEDAEEDDWSSTCPSEPGTWWIRAVIPDTKNYAGAVATTSFTLWETPADIYTDSVTFTMSGYTGSETLEGFVVPLRLSEATLPGFSYARVGGRGGLAFVCGNDILPYDVESWNPNGESVVWVKVPSLTSATTITMWWHANAGFALGGNDPAAVWSEYHGVWHFGETIEAETAATTSTADATGNGHDAEPKSYHQDPSLLGQMVSVAGVIGNARQTTAGLYTRGPRFELRDTDGLQLGGRFTISGWYNMQHHGSGGAGLMLFGRKDAQSANDGFYGQHASSSSISIYAQGASSRNASVTLRGGNPDVAGWNFFAFTYDATQLTALLRNGMDEATASGTIDPAGDNGKTITLGNYAGNQNLASFAGFFDEFRISKTPRSAAWLKAEIESAQKTDFTSAGLVTVAGKKVNGWVREPSISPQSWDLSQIPSFTIDPGQLVEGHSKVAYYRLEDPETPLAVTGPEAFTAAGQYRAVFSIDDPEGLYHPLEREFQLTLTARSPYTDISGRVGDSGRVLLMNRDENPASPVDYQGYNDTIPDEASTYWEHTEFEPTTYFHLMNATKSALKKTDEAGTILWQLSDCRHGNTFPARDDVTLPTGQVFLPWASETAKRFDGRGEAATARSHAGTLVMRNTADAVVTSGVFEDGIGTFYFDAANGWTSGADETGENYRLAVDYAEADGEWRRVPEIRLFKRDGTPDFVEETAEGGEFALAIKTGGTTENFYRVVVPLHTTRPVRVRISRLTFNANQAEDRSSLILLDNLIVSYPAMRADLEPTGFYDETRRGKQVLGWAGATETPFPAAGEPDLRIRAKMTSVTNPGVPVEDPSAFIASTILHYRWRYLGARFSPETGWRSVALNPMADFRAAKPIEIPGAEGDVEFWYETLLSAPYYDYVDYTGLGLSLPYSEEVSVVTNRYKGVTLPSGGSDWFFRLRAGKSKYEGIKMIVVKNEEGAEEEVIDFELTRNRLWRGFFKTLENSAGTYRYRFVATEPADPTGLTPARITYTWRTLGVVTETPIALSYASAAPTEWSEITVDATTGHLMFQLNEDTETVSIAHADYQDFNRWNDAHRDGGVFVGTSTEGEKRVGVSAEMRDFAEEFEKWTDTPATSPYWIENFTAASLPTFEPIQETITPNGWRARQGMYVNQSWMDGSSGYAFQLKGSGYGELEYPSKAINPRGLESVVFKARLGQQLTFNDFSYYNAGSRESRAMRNYTFVAQAAMSNVGWTSNHSAKDFDGAGQISLIAAYQPNKGCYELRVTRIAEERCRYELYKWSVRNGAMTAERVAGPMDQNLIVFHKWHNSNTAPWEYGTFYISIDAVEGGGQRVTAGSSRNHAQFGVKPTRLDYTALKFYDNSTTSLDYGSYGVAATSCPALILAPRVYSESVPWDTSVGPGQGKSTSNVDITFDETKRTDEPSNFEDWAIASGRAEVFADTESRVNRWGLVNLASPQKVLVQRRATADAMWETVAERTVSGFSLNHEEIVEVYEPLDGTYRIIHGAGMDEPRTDVIIDDVELRQWRGDDYGSPDTQGWCAPNDGYGYRTNFVFSSGWIRHHRVKLSAKRTLPTDRSAIRSPLLDGRSGRGLGLGMVSYAYENAQENTRVLIQVAEVDQASALVPESAWQTVATNDFSTLTSQERAGGVINHYIGRHGVAGLVRIVIDPKLSEEVKDEINLARFGEIDITGIVVRDEPELDLRSWWGWNLRLVNGDGSSVWDDGTRTYLPDWGTHAGDMGFSLALNDSITKDIDGSESDAYHKHMPFVQTPTFTENVVGEVSFKARKFDAANDQAAEVRLYGALSGDPNDPSLTWTMLKHFVISNDTYETYHYRLPDSSYRAFRLGVSGVRGVDNGERGDEPTEGDEPVRVLIDELVVSEAVYPRLGFRYAYPTRTGLMTHAKSPVYDVTTGRPLCDEQPLKGENWTVQAEIQVKQLPEEIDLDTPGREPRVYLHWFKGGMPWGYTWWKDERAAKRAELLPIDDDAMTFRGSFVRAPEAVVEESEDEGAIVQYILSVDYYDREGIRHTSFMDRGEWTTPEWYNPIDYNEGSPDFAAFTILESIAPHRAWINEANIYDNEDVRGLIASTNQYVEIAVPQAQSIAGWTLEYVKNDYKSETLCTFGTGAGNVTPTKVGPVTNDYTFLVVQSPKTAASDMWRNVKRPDGEPVAMDGTWSAEVTDGGELEQYYPIALRLKRPSGIIATEIALEGTNFWQSLGYNSYKLETWVDEARGEFPKTRLFAAGRESENKPVTGLAGQSLGVFESVGETSGQWNAVMHQTPGWVNEGQTVPEGYVIYPDTAKIIVTARIVGKGLTQSVDGDEPTVEEVRLTVPKGGDGVPVVYGIGTWHELKNVTTNGVVVAGSEGCRGAYTLSGVGRGADRNVTVIATAIPRGDLDLDPESPYAEAILDWLDAGKNFFGESFKSSDGVLRPAEYWSLNPHVKQSELSLTEMYWLDIDPTEGNWRLEAGIRDVKTKAKVAATRMKFAIGPTDDAGEGSAANTATENLLVTVKMTMTNTVSGASYAPYVMRGRASGETSVSHQASAEGNWQSASFKVTGDLQNGNPDRTRWVPLRWFYFLPDATKANRSASFDANNEAVIEVWDPFDNSHGGTTSGWDKYRGSLILYRWAIDERIMPVQVEPLAPQSTY